MAVPSRVVVPAGDEGCHVTTTGTSDFSLTDELTRKIQENPRSAVQYAAELLRAKDRTDRDRAVAASALARGLLDMNNLLQVSSAFGRTMETMNPDLTALALYPYLLEIEDERARENVIAAACEGYAFPTNLDKDPPIGGLAPASQADLVRTAVAERWPVERLRTEFDARNARRAGLGQ